MSILIKPIITEKANNDSELNNRYTFQVEKNANKRIAIDIFLRDFHGGFL